MSNSEVLSRTQRIIVNGPGNITVVNAGPPGPAGSGALVLPFTQTGLIEIKSGVFEYPISEFYRLKRIRAKLLTGTPVGGDLIFNFSVTLPGEAKESVWSDSQDYPKIVDGTTDSGPIEVFDISVLPADTLVGPFDIVGVPPNLVYNLIFAVELTK